MLLKLALKNLISRKSSLLIALFIAFSIGLFCVANAVFDSTEQGVEASYISSFTGDFIIRPTTKGQFSLFGDETPITGSFTRLETVVPYVEIAALLDESVGVSSFTPQLTGTAALEYGGTRYVMVLFGVDAHEYLSLMDSVSLVVGEPYMSGSKGVMVSESFAKKSGVSVGDFVQFVISDGPYFRIRKAQVTAIYSYKVDNPIFERFVLVNPQAVAELMDVQTVSEEIEIEEEKISLLDSELDLDSLFDITEDVAVENNQRLSAESAGNVSAFNLQITYLSSSLQSNSSWHYIVGRAQNQKAAKKIIHGLNKTFRKNGWPVEAVDWRHAAGSTALYLHWLRIILNVGIVIVLFAGFIIVNNTLTVNVLDRTCEMGTMRAVGASKKYIALECMAETLLLSVAGGICGIFLGFAACAFINRLHIHFVNEYLVQLFGSGQLAIYVSFRNVVRLIMVSFGIGFLSWVYPVINALKITPVQAMEGTK